MSYIRFVTPVSHILISSTSWLPAQDVDLPGSTSQGDILRAQAQFLKGAAWYEVNAARARDLHDLRRASFCPEPGTGDGAGNPRKRANRHWRCFAYQACRARSRVRLTLVASIVRFLLRT